MVQVSSDSFFHVVKCFGANAAIIIWILSPLVEICGGLYLIYLAIEAACVVKVVIQYICK